MEKGDMMIRPGLLSVGVAAMFIASIATAQSSHYVNGYVKSDGTYVAPHYQTNPNQTRNDNWSTRGNVNPYTGEAGTKPRDGEEPTHRSSYRQYEAPAPDARSSYSSHPENSSYGSPDMSGSWAPEGPEQPNPY
jgi:hypothetical protein